MSKNLYSLTAGAILLELYGRDSMVNWRDNPKLKAIYAELDKGNRSVMIKKSPKPPAILSTLNKNNSQVVK